MFLRLPFGDGDGEAIHPVMLTAMGLAQNSHCFLISDQIPLWMFVFLY